MKLTKLPARLNPAANPIVLKELRQAVRSRFVATIILLFLATEVIISLVSLNIADSSSAMISRHGAGMFGVLYGFLAVALLLFIPLYTGIRLTAERWDSNMDLFFVTTISPSSIIRGKMMSGLILILLLVSAAAPFMSVSYILRGIDIPTILLSIFVLIITSLVLSQLALLIASVPAGRVLKIIIWIISFFFTLSIVMQSFGIIMFGLVADGLGTDFNDPEFWGAFGFFIILAACVIQLAHSIAVALISSPFSNRAFKLRITVTAIWIILAICTKAICLITGEEDIMFGWFITSMVALFLTSFVVLSEPPLTSVRVLTKIPKNRLKRFFAFLFFNGPVGGALWLTSIALLTSIFMWIDMQLTGADSNSNIVWAFTLSLIYTAAYGLIALSFYRRFFQKKYTQKMVPFICACLILTGTLIPLLAGLIVRSGSHDALLWHTGCMFTTGSFEHIVEHMIFLIPALVIGFAVNRKWISSQISNFKPLRVDVNND